MLFFFIFPNSDFWDYNPATDPDFTSSGKNCPGGVKTVSGDIFWNPGKCLKKCRKRFVFNKLSLHIIKLRNDF